MIDMYLILLNLGSMSFNVGPLCIGFINACFNHAGYKHTLALPLALGTKTKVLHHSDILSTSCGVIMSSCCSLSNLSLNIFVAHMLHILVAFDMACYWVQAETRMCLQSTQYHETHYQISCVFFCISLALFLLSVSSFGHDRKYFASVFVLVLTMQVNVIRYSDFLSNFRLWYPELASMIDMYLILLNLGSMSFNVGPLCIGFINACFNHAGYKHTLALPLALGTKTKVLHHSDILSTSCGVIMSSCCSLSNLSLNIFVAHMLHILVAFDMACYWVQAETRMCLQSTQYHETHYQISCVFFLY